MSDNASILTPRQRWSITGVPDWEAAVMTLRISFRSLKTFSNMPSP